MDNNQQVADTTSQSQTGPAPMIKESYGGFGSVDLNVNDPGTITVPSAFTGQDVSMTTPQFAGGNITTTEAGSK